jgi:hypothetical protein
MDLRQQLSALESRQIELRNTMAASDAHASKCAKLGLDFKITYPDDYTAYIAANDEFNTNEKQLATLQAQLDEMSGEGEEMREESV